VLINPLDAMALRLGSTDPPLTILETLVPELTRKLSSIED